MMTNNFQRADGGARRVSEFDPGRLEGELQRLLRGQTARPHRDVNKVLLLSLVNMSIMRCLIGR